MVDWPSAPNPWKVKQSALVRENAFFAVEANTVEAPDGQTRDYDIVRMRRVGVGILPIEADGAVHVIGQWRLPIARYSWETPAGGVEAGEDALVAARRELEEESGLTAGVWLQAIELDLSTSLTDKHAIGYLCWDLAATRVHPEEREVLQRRRVHFLDVMNAIASGQIREALSVAILLRAHQLALTGALPLPLSQAMLGVSR